MVTNSGHMSRVELRTKLLILFSSFLFVSLLTFKLIIIRNFFFKLLMIRSLSLRIGTKLSALFYVMKYYSVLLLKRGSDIHSSLWFDPLIRTAAVHTQLINPEPH